MYLPNQLGKTKRTPERALQGLEKIHAHPAKVSKHIEPCVAELIYRILLHGLPDYGKITLI